MPANTSLRLALITGNHPFDVPALYRVFSSMQGVEFCPQGLEEFATSIPEIRRSYDVVAFYNMHRGTPGEGPEGWRGAAETALSELGEISQGLVILHHAVLAFERWPRWREITGVDGAEFQYFVGETVRVEIADPDHEITRGLTPWEMVDETYIMSEPDADSRVLLTTDHAKSMEALAWTRQHGLARVLCLQSGHDDETYSHPSFRALVERGIRWAAEG